MSWIPASSPAQAASIATGIVAAVEMIVLHAACRAWGARPVAATAAVVIFAGAPIVLGMYTEAEVFALNGLAVALVLWLSASKGPVQGAWRAFALGLVAGAGMANHMTCTLVAPVGLLGIARAVREASPRVLAFAVLGFIIGLTPYLYLLVAPVHQGSWGDIHDLSDVIDTALRRDYGGPGAFAGPGGARPIAANLAAFALTLGRTWLWLPAAGAIAMLLHHSIRKGHTETRAGWTALLLSFIASGPLLVLKFNLIPSGVGLAVVNRFHILPALMLCIPAAVAFEHLVTALDGKLSLRPWLVRSAMVAAFASVVAASLPHARAVHVPAVEYEVRNTLASLPASAVVFAASDDFGGGVNYVQLVSGQRTDVLYVHWPLMALGWYRERIAARGLPFDVTASGSPSVRAAETVLAMGRPLFVDHGQANILKTLPCHPYGVLMRVLPRGTQPPPLDEQIAINTAVYEGFVLPYPTPEPDDEWPADVHRKYAWTWEYFGKMLRRAGRSEDAARAFAAAKAIGPRAP